MNTTITLTPLPPLAPFVRYARRGGVVNLLLGEREDEMGQREYEYISVEVFPLTYDNIVSAIIRGKYTADEMEAITNNMTATVGEFLNVLVGEGIVKATKYLVDNIDSDKTKAFKEMQEWRRMAKDKAKEIINNQLNNQ